MNPGTQLVKRVKFHMFLLLELLISDGNLLSCGPNASCNNITYPMQPEANERGHRRRGLGNQGKADLPRCLNGSLDWFAIFSARPFFESVPQRPQSRSTDVRADLCFKSLAESFVLYVTLASCPDTSWNWKH